MTRAALFENRIGRAFAALAIAAGVALTPSPAAAQVPMPCVLPGDSVDDYYTLFIATVGDAVFPLANEAVCNKLTKSVVSGCQKAVAANLKCFQQVYKSYASAAKTSCATFGDRKETCNAEFAASFSLAASRLESLGDAAADECEERADEFWDWCFSGLP